MKRPKSIFLMIHLRIAALLLLFVLMAMSPLTGQRNSLFHRAIALDTLYSAIEKGDRQAAEKFFNNLQSLYNSSNLPDPSAIRSDFSNNYYLENKVNNVFNQLSLREDNRGRLVNELQARKDSLFQAAIKEGEIHCNRMISQSGNCDLSEVLRQLATTPADSTMREFRMASENEALTKKLFDLENQIYDIDLQLERERKLDQAILQINAEAGSSEPFGMARSTSLNTLPIIIQSSGPTSLQASVLDGAAKWIAERMREELSIAFFDRFETWVEDENIRVLFPNTFSTIGNSMSVDYSLMLQVLKTAFEKDLKALPFSMGNYLRLEMDAGANILAANEQLVYAYDSLRRIEAIEDSLYNDLAREKFTFDSLKQLQRSGEDIDLDHLEMAELDFMLAELSVGIEVDLSKMVANDLIERAEASVEQNARILKYVLFTIDAINQLKEGEHPSNLLTYLSDRVEALFPESSNLKPALLVMDVVSRSLISVDRDQGTVWIRGDELEQLRRDEQLREIFFGLIYQETKQRMRSTRSNLAEQMHDIAYETTSGAFNLASYNYASQTDYAVKSALRYFDTEFVNISRNEAEAMAKSLIQQNFSSEKNRTKATIEAALLTYHQQLRPLGQGRFSYDHAEMQRIEQRAENALRVLDNTLGELGRNSSQETVEGWKETARYCLNLESGVDEEVELLPAKAYRDKIEYNLNGFYGFYAEAEPLASQLKEAALLAAEPIIEKQVYRDRINPFLQRTRQEVFAEIHQEYVVVDSLAIEQEAIMNVPETRMLQLKMDRLTNHQHFIDGLMLDNPRAFSNLVSNFIGFADRFDALQADYRALRREKEANLGSTQFIFLLKNSMELLQQVFTLAIPDDLESLERVNFLSNNVLDAYTGVLEKDYDAVMMNIVPVANTLVDLHFEGLIGKAGTNQLVVDSLRARQADRQLKLQEIFRYGAFLAAVAEARSSEDIKYAIRAIALPAGSYSIKRRAVSNISLNAYPGITGGLELASNENLNAWGGNFGFTAPIGLAFSWGYRSRIDHQRYLADRSYQRAVDKSPILPDEKFLNGSSGSLYFPLIDLGALVLFRLDNSFSPLPEDVGFQQVFSPGIIYAHGFNNLPLALMGGMQVSPQLRKFGDSRLNAFRFNLGLTVDLPMINFHTRRVPRTPKAKRNK